MTDVIVMFVRSNNGTLSKAKRGKFSELTDEGINALESVICATLNRYLTT